MKWNTLLRQKAENKTTNLAGGEAFGESPKLELVSILLTGFLDTQFYRSGNATADRIRHLINQIRDKEFIAKAAIYARKQAGMRSASHLVAGDLARNVKGVDWTKRFFNRVVHRPDDALEILAYYMAVHGKPLPNALKKGLGQALCRFDAYQLAKYRRPGAELSLVDAVNLVHPPHTPALADLIRGRLAAADTWETKLTQAGRSDTDTAVEKSSAWGELIRARKLGYFALLRNLRNILAQAPEAVEGAIDLLTDRNLISKSLVMPFRFRSAIDALSDSKVNSPEVQKVLAALSKAVDISLENVPTFVGRTLIAMDCSGSMIGRPMKVGSLFAATLYKANDADLLLFSGGARYVRFDKNDATLTLAARIEEKAEWSGTNFHAIFEAAHGDYDRVIILSDMQAWMGHHTPKRAFDAYVKRSGNRPRIFSFDLAGHGTLQFPESGVFALAGFSDKTMDTLQFLEEDRYALLREIEAVAL